jgi:hypothetical protein
MWLMRMFTFVLQARSLAQRGVRDQEQLAADAVKFISANYVENYSTKIESRKDPALS